MFGNLNSEQVEKILPAYKDIQRHLEMHVLGVYEAGPESAIFAANASTIGRLINGLRAVDAVVETLEKKLSDMTIDGVAVQERI